MDGEEKREKPISGYCGVIPSANMPVLILTVGGLPHLCAPSSLHNSSFIIEVQRTQY